MYINISQCNWRALTNIDQNLIFYSRYLILRDFNAYSSIQNALDLIRKDAKVLERLIDRYNLFINNNLDMSIRPYKIQIS